MAPHSSTLAWKIPWTEEPGRLQSPVGSLRVGPDWATSLSLFTFMHPRRKWQPTPVFLSGESQGRGAWWAAVYGVAQSRTQLKRLSGSTLLLALVFLLFFFPSSSYLFPSLILPFYLLVCACIWDNPICVSFLLYFFNRYFDYTVSLMNHTCVTSFLGTFEYWMLMYLQLQILETSQDK